MRAMGEALGWDEIEESSSGVWSKVQGGRCGGLIGIGDEPVAPPVDLVAEHPKPAEPRWTARASSPGLAARRAMGFGRVVARQ